MHDVLLKPSGSLEETWMQVRAQLRAAIGGDEFDMWCKSIHINEQMSTNQKIVLTVPTPSLRDWVGSHYRSGIQTLWAGEAGDPALIVSIRVRPIGGIAPVTRLAWQQRVLPRRAESQMGLQQKTAAELLAEEQQRAQQEYEGRLCSEPEPRLNVIRQTVFEWLGVPLDVQGFCSREDVQRGKEISMILAEDLCRDLPFEKISWYIVGVNPARARSRLLGFILPKKYPALRELVEKRLGALVFRPESIHIEDILKAVSRHFKVPIREILSDRRFKTIVLPRQIAMYLTKKLMDKGLPEIGRRFGGRDHTTVLHAVRKVEKLMHEDADFRTEVELLEQMTLTLHAR